MPEVPWKILAPIISALASAGVAAGVAYLLTMDDREQLALYREQEGHYQQQELFNQAWNRINSYAGDPSKSGGLRDAIELLAGEGKPLRRLYLYNAQLQGLTLPPEANLNGVQLVRADLQDSVMPEVKMSGAWLSAAHLVGSCLKGADLSGAVVGAATLNEVLWGAANLEGADLRGANLDGKNEYWAGVELRGADLRGAKGLSCEKLQRALNWQEAFRVEALSCDAEIPRREEPPRCDELGVD